MVILVAIALAPVTIPLQHQQSSLIRSFPLAHNGQHSTSTLGAVTYIAAACGYELAEWQLRVSESMASSVPPDQLSG